jgi:putative flippase GtrA
MRSWASMKPPIFRYGLVGVLNTGIHAVVLFVLSSVLGISLGVSNLSAFLCAATFSYFVNSYFTFSKKPNSRGYALFLSLNGLLAYAIGFSGEIVFASALQVFLIFSGISFLLGFYMSKKWIFAK